jgi:hypothetical protein
VLHGLKHPGHLAADVARPGAVNDSGDAAHVTNPSRPSRPAAFRYGRTSRYSATSQSETVAQ